MGGAQQHAKTTVKPTAHDELTNNIVKVPLLWWLWKTNICCVQLYLESWYGITLALTGSEASKERMQSVQLKRDGGERVNKYNSVCVCFWERERERECVGGSNSVEHCFHLKRSDPAKLSISLKQAGSAGKQGHWDSKPHTYTYVQKNQNISDYLWNVLYNFTLFSYLSLKKYTTVQSVKYVRFVFTTFIKLGNYVTKTISNQCCSFEWFIEESWKTYIMVAPKILCSTTVSTLLIIRPPNQYIIMISEGSCDTGDWSNDCWKFSFAMTEINYILNRDLCLPKEMYLFKW